ncbi:MAG: hypothetical protein ABI466_07555 [Chloroflexota bacterium]
MIKDKSARRPESLRMFAGVSERENNFWAHQLNFALEPLVVAGIPGGCRDLPLLQWRRGLLLFALRQVREVRAPGRAFARSEDVTKKTHGPLVQGTAAGPKRLERHRFLLGGKSRRTAFPKGALVSLTLELMKPVVLSIQANTYRSGLTEHSHQHLVAESTWPERKAARWDATLGTAHDPLAVQDT